MLKPPPPPPLSSRRSSMSSLFPSGVHFMASLLHSTPSVYLARLFLHDLFERVGKYEIVEVDRVLRRSVRTPMDSRLAKVDTLRAFGFQLLVQHQSAVKPKPRVPFTRVFRPMDMHRQLVPFTDREVGFPVRAVAPEVARAIADQRSAARFRLDPPRHYVVPLRRRRSLPIEEIVAILRRLGHVHIEG